MDSIVRVEMTEDRIRELEVRSTEFIQSEQHRGKQTKNNGAEPHRRVGQEKDPPVICSHKDT